MMSYSFYPFLQEHAALTLSTNNTVTLGTLEFMMQIQVLKE